MAARHRLAVIARPFPPDRIGRRVDPTAGLRDFYYAMLWQHWRRAQRALGVALGAGRAVPALARAVAGERHALAGWRSGFSAALLRDLDSRRLPGARADAFIDQEERKGLHALLNPEAVPFDRNPLKNKAAFDARCRAAALPLPASIADAADALALGADAALIVKPQYGSKGKGVRRVTRQPDGSWRDGDRRIAPSELDDWIAAEAKCGQIVQECLRVAPSLAPLSPGALPTLRIVTCRDEAGVPEVTDVALRLSLAPDGAADNFNADNLVCAVDEGGDAGPALRRRTGGFESCESHPLTGATIRGHRLAGYAAARRLALDAHRAMPASFIVIGWDIGLADRGPVLIEGNWNPGYNVMQLVHGVGLGETRLGELYRFHLARLPGDRWRAAEPLVVAQSPFAQYSDGIPDRASPRSRIAAA